MRAAFRALLLSSSALTDLIPANRWAARGSIAYDSLDRPFVIIATAGDNRFLRGARREESPQDFEIWVHDEPGSYVLIDEVMQEMIALFEGTADFQFGGWRIAQVDYQSTSPDLSDDGLRTLTRSMRVRATGGRL